MFGGVEAFESRVWAISDNPMTAKRGTGLPQGCGLFARSIEPFQVRLFPEPDQLTSGITPVLRHDELARRRQVSLAAQELHHLPIDEPAERVRVRRHATGQD